MKAQQINKNFKTNFHVRKLREKMYILDIENRHISNILVSNQHVHLKLSVMSIYINFKNHCFKKKVDMSFKLSSMDFPLIYPGMTNN